MVNQPHMSNFLSEISQQQSQDCVDILEAHLKHQQVLETGTILVWMVFMLNDNHLYICCTQLY